MKSGFLKISLPLIAGFLIVLFAVLNLNGKVFATTFPKTICHNTPGNNVTLTFQNQQSYNGHLGTPHSGSTFDTNGPCASTSPSPTPTPSVSPSPSPSVSPTPSPSPTPTPSASPSPSVSPTPSLSPSPSPSVSPSPSTNPQVKGSIRVCKIVIDSNNAIINASGAPGVTFSISGLNTTTSQGGPAGVLGTSTFTTPLTLSSKALGSSTTNDSQCTTYSNLDLGNYYYGQESISSGNWAAPKYTDQFTVSANTISDFYNYDNKLFDADSANDGARNTNADGHIVLEVNNPNRTLIVLNQLQATTSISIGGAGFSATSGSSCSVNGPQRVDQVWFSGITATSVMVHWANKGDAAGYHIQYGPSANNLPWGTEVAGNVNFVTLNNLPGGDLWVTITAKQSAECGGPTTDPVKVAAGIGGGQVLGVKTGPQVLAATGSSNLFALAISGFGMIATGAWQALKARVSGRRVK